jgi:hypothetical protein
MVPLSIEWLAAHAELVVHGTVVSTTVQRDPEGRIYTSVQLQVTEVWKGATTNRFTLVHGGGILGEQGQSVSGEAGYEVGEELVSFMVVNKRGEGVSLGLSQGKFKVSKDPATGEILVQNRFHGHNPQATNSAVQTLPNGRVIINRLTLADLKQRVQGGAK